MVGCNPLAVCHDSLIFKGKQLNNEQTLTDAKVNGAFVVSGQARCAVSGLT